MATTEGGRARDLEDISDPLVRLERNERSSRSAIRYLLLSILAVITTSVAITLIGDVTGPACPRPPQLCTTPVRVEVVAIPTLLALLLAIGASWQTYRRWQEHIRWRPWLWVTQLLWLAATAYMLVSASVVFIR